MKHKYKRKVINRANKLIGWLYSFNIKAGHKKYFTTQEKFDLLEYDQKIRQLTQELIDKWKK